MSPELQANKLTRLLDARDGPDRFDRGPVNPEWLAREYSVQICPAEPIKVVRGEILDGCAGALVFGVTRPRQWGILYDVRQDPGRRSFTIAHEFGHYVLHRGMIEATTSGGLYCSEQDVEQRTGSTDIEKEADLFAATLLMPFHDFRRQLGANQRADFSILSRLAARYGVSLTAAILRWLEYTETRALVIVSNEGYALWSKPSSTALRSGRFIRTKNEMFELPAGAVAKVRTSGSPPILSIEQPAGVWFDEPVNEISLRANRLDQEITLLQLDPIIRQLDEEEVVPDLVDRLTSAR